MSNIPARYKDFNLAVAISTMDEASEYVHNTSDYFEVTDYSKDPQGRLEKVANLLAGISRIRDFVEANSRLATSDEVADQLKLLLLRYSDADRSGKADKVGALLFADTLELEPTILELNLACSLLKYRCKFRPRANDMFDAIDEVRRIINRPALIGGILQSRQKKLQDYKKKFDRYQVSRKWRDMVRECIYALTNDSDTSGFDDKIVADAKKWQRINDEHRDGKQQ